jgi:hypothetical protein
VSRRSLARFFAAVYKLIASGLRTLANDGNRGREGDKGFFL